MKTVFHTAFFGLTFVIAGQVHAVETQRHPISAPTLSFTKTNGFGYGDYVPLDTTLEGSVQGARREISVSTMNLIDANGKSLGVGHLYVHKDAIEALRAGRPAPLSWVLVDQATAQIKQVEAVGSVTPDGKVTLLGDMKAELEIRKPSLFNLNDIDVGHSQNARLEMKMPNAGVKNAQGFIPKPESPIQPSARYRVNPVDLPPESPIKPGARYSTMPIPETPKNIRPGRGGYRALGIGGAVGAAWMAGSLAAEAHTAEEEAHTGEFRHGDVEGQDASLSLSDEYLNQ